MVLRLIYTLVLVSYAVGQNNICDFSDQLPPGNASLELFSRGFPSASKDKLCQCVITSSAGVDTQVEIQVELEINTTASCPPALLVDQPDEYYYLCAAGSKVMKTVERQLRASESIKISLFNSGESKFFSTYSINGEQSLSIKCGQAVKKFNSGSCLCPAVTEIGESDPWGYTPVQRGDDWTTKTRLTIGFCSALAILALIGAFAAVHYTSRRKMHVMELADSRTLGYSNS